ncbi:MAG: hypothetical protein HY907_01775 [Deltaproteobacteria bacterium]|nr:hypothetical protein [Deltaproteobacteria bacterium]
MRWVVKGLFVLAALAVLVYALYLFWLKDASLWVRLGGIAGAFILFSIGVGMSSEALDAQTFRYFDKEKGVGLEPVAEDEARGSPDGGKYCKVERGRKSGRVRSVAYYEASRGADGTMAWRLARMEMFGKDGSVAHASAPGAKVGSGG